MFPSSSLSSASSSQTFRNRSFSDNSETNTPSAERNENEFLESPSPVVTAWTKATKTRRGAFGSRGGFGAVFKKTTFGRQRPAEESGYLEEQSSPDASSSQSIRSSLTDRDSCHLPTEEPINPSPREQEVENFLNRNKPPVLHRMNSLTALPPKKPTGIRHQRRFSLVDSVRESSGSSTEEQNYPDWLSSALPSNHHHGTEDICETNGQRERKKSRARRNSIQGTVVPLSESESRSCTHLARSREAWREIERSSPSNTFDISESNLFGSPARSVASSRKRGVGGSPLCSDVEDLSSTGGLSVSNGSRSGRPTRSRSRVFSPESQMLPFQFPKLENCRGSPENDRGVMDIDTDDDRDDDSDDSPNTSFESSENEMSTIFKSDPAVTRFVENEREILESLDSYADLSYNELKFVVKGLLKQEKISSTTFAGSWTVCPDPGWDSNRRSSFIRWATHHLGFSLCSAGASVTFLRIQKTKGTELLKNLKAGLLAHRKESKKEERNQPASTNDSFVLDITSMGRARAAARSPLAHSNGSIFGRDQFKPDTDDVAVDLTERMKSLGVEDSCRLSDGALARQVTLEQTQESLQDRQSLEQHVAFVSDINAHIQGLPSNEPLSRPPRCSLTSVHSSCVSETGKPSVSCVGVLGAAPSFDVMETPLMTQDDAWGSRPLPGRDWGSSARCDDEVTAQLLASYDLMDKDSPDQESNPSVMNFDFELESDCVEIQIVAESPEVSAQQIRFLDPKTDEKCLRKRRMSFEKHRRMSVFMSASQNRESLLLQKTGLFRPSAAFGRVERSFRCDEFPEFSERSGNVDEDVFSVKILDEQILASVFSFLPERELLLTTSLVNSTWAEASAVAHAKLILESLGAIDDDDEHVDDDECGALVDGTLRRLAPTHASERPWSYVRETFPWGRFLAEGGMKRVYRVYNAAVGAEEAVSVINIDEVVDKQVLVAELAVSSLLSSLTRRGICPNFVLTRSVFTCSYDAPRSLWGCPENEMPQGPTYDAKSRRRQPPMPNESDMGRFQFIRMEICSEGDVEEFIKNQPNGSLDANVAQSILFQIAFALHTAAERYSVKHYDIKLLNVFLNRPEGYEDGLVMRYGLGSHVFRLAMPPGAELVAKLADYGTANVQPESSGQPVTIAQYTTLENTPVDYLLLGDAALQGHGHDNFGLGLCMLHLFTGHCPYEEILCDVKCPPALKKRLRIVWEDETSAGYETLRSVILSDVYKDEAGHIIEGEPDETLYDTLYRFIVLFGIPEEKFDRRRCPKVWDAVIDCLVGRSARKSKKTSSSRMNGPDSTQYNRDRRKYSIRAGNNLYISRARARLESMDGGMDLLTQLCCFDPSRRASAMDVLNSKFMANLREEPGMTYSDENVLSYTAFSTHHFQSNERSEPDL